MAKNSSTSPVIGLFAISLIVFLLANSVGVAKGGLAAAEGEVVYPEALCEKASQTFSGTCRNTGSCDNQCIKWEGAAHGACHNRDGKKMCFCYFNGC